MTQPVNPTASRYDPATIGFHWATAVLVAFQWIGAQTIDWFPSGSPRIDARSVHITVGALLAMLLVARLSWRLTKGRRLPLADRGAVNVLAKGTHWGLYALLLAMVSVGITLAWARGDSLYNVISIPPLDPSDHGLRHRLQDLHATLGWIIVGLAGLHAGAALVHRYVWHDGVLDRMLPLGLKRARTNQIRLNR